MCAIEAGKRGRRVLVLEKASKIGKKILISGGGRCNFTNVSASPENYISSNEHFCKSALARYSPQDFIELVEKHGIPYHEKKLGQLFCNGSSREIVGMLLKECEAGSVEVRTNSSVSKIERGEGFCLTLHGGEELLCASLVIATGGISIPKMGATGFGYDVARQFGMRVTERKPGLVPLVFAKEFLTKIDELSGVSIDAIVRCNGTEFRENILFTHRGVSGPAVLQGSSFWNEGDTVTVDLMPDFEIAKALKDELNKNKELKSFFSEYLPKRFVQRVFELWLTNQPLRSVSPKDSDEIEAFFHGWQLHPSGTEGYRTAEVTVGGVDVNEISSKSFESKKVPGLFFIGEVLDVTGWLGGYNFQWAWASGYCAGQFV